MLTLKKGGAGFAQIQKGLQRLQGNQVLVGIPEDANLRKPENGKPAPIGNAALLYVLTNGSPLRGIPATPVIEPALAAEDNHKVIAGILRQAAEAELAGNHPEALQLMARAGTAGANAAKRWFTDPRNGWPPNALSTINRKLNTLTPAQRERAIDKIVAAKGDTTGVVTRNIDTGELRRSLTYLVLDGGAERQTSDMPELEVEAGEAEELGEIAEIALL